MKIPRRQYNDLYGPTAGDRIRLADTDLLIEITRDLTVHGEEAKFGGGKVIRDGMGQSPSATRAKGALRVVRKIVSDQHALQINRAGRQPYPLALMLVSY